VLESQKSGRLRSVILQQMVDNLLGREMAAFADGNSGSAWGEMILLWLIFRRHGGPAGAGRVAFGRIT